MKTAEEWWDDSCPDKMGGREVIEWVKEIQLDAIKNGMTLAAELCLKNAEGCTQITDGRAADERRAHLTDEATIVFALDNLKELP